MRNRMKDRAAQRQIRDCFEESVTKVLPPVVPRRLRAPRGPMALAPLFNVTIHVGIVALVAILLCLLPGALRRATPLREDIASIVRERSYVSYLPTKESIMESLSRYFERRNER